MSERKRPEAEEAMLRLLVDDAEEYERMLAEGHRELCIEYQPLIPALVDAAVVGRQLTSELTEARDYLKECPICAEALESSSKALRELAEEDGQEEDEPFVPPRKDLPAEPKKEPGKLEAWWQRFTKTKGGLIAIVGAVLCVIALAGLFVHSGRQWAREEARRDKTDAAVPAVTRDAGPRRPAPDAAIDPRSWLRKKGPLKFMFITLHLAGERQATARKGLHKVAAELKRLTTGGNKLQPADVKRLRSVVKSESAAVERLTGPLAQATRFIATVKDDGSAPDFLQQIGAAQKQLAERRKSQTDLQALIKSLRKQLGIKK